MVQSSCAVQYTVVSTKSTHQNTGGTIEGTLWFHIYQGFNSSFSSRRKAINPHHDDGCYFWFNPMSLFVDYNKGNSFIHRKRPLACKCQFGTVVCTVFFSDACRVVSCHQDCTVGHRTGNATAETTHRYKYKYRTCFSICFCCCTV